MPSLKVDGFPDGVHEVPLVRGGGDGSEIGTAVVTFEDGLWSATIKLDDVAARDLGIVLVFQHETSSIHGEKAAVVIANLYDKEW